MFGCRRDTSNGAQRGPASSTLPTFHACIVSALLATGLLAAFAPRAEAVSATGGTVTNYDENGTNWTAHIFTTVGTTNLNVTSGGNVEVLVVGGGGGGGSRFGGGGGAGGVIYTGSYAVAAGSSYTVAVGGGGIGGATSGGPGTSGACDGGTGTNSSFGSLTAYGGGGGGDHVPVCKMRTWP